MFCNMVSHHLMDGKLCTTYAGTRTRTRGMIHEKKTRIQNRGECYMKKLGYEIVGRVNIKIIGVYIYKS